MNISFRGLMDFHYIFHLAVSTPEHNIYVVCMT